MPEKEHNRGTVFDPLRRKNVAITPEEGVRQSFIKFLIARRGWPKTMLMSETQISSGAVKFRCDIVGYNKHLEPELVVECKAPDVRVSQKTIEQVWRYALVLKVKWIVVTNGKVTFACRYNTEEKRYEYISDIPYYTEG